VCCFWVLLSRSSCRMDAIKPRLHRNRGARRRKSPSPPVRQDNGADRDVCALSHRSHCGPADDDPSRARLWPAGVGLSCRAIAAPSPIGERISAAAASSLVRRPKAGCPRSIDPNHDRAGDHRVLCAMERGTAAFPRSGPARISTLLQSFARASTITPCTSTIPAECQPIRRSRFSPHIMPEEHRT